MQSTTQLAVLSTASLYHDFERGLIICTQHCSALVPSSIIYHLRNKHKIKGKELQDVQTYLNTLGKDSLNGPETVIQPEHYSHAVPKIAVIKGFACNVTNCSQVSGWLSEHLRTVEKHIAKEHCMQQSSSSQPRENKQIINVHFQSLFLGVNYKPFLIRQDLEQESLHNKSSHAISYNKQHVERSKIIQASYTTSQEKIKAQLHAVTLEPYEGQVPPWLQTTGIAQWLGGLSKKDVYSSCHSTDDDPTWKRIQSSTYECLKLISSSVKTGVSESRLNRVAARILNSFEPDRTQIKPFKPVQEESTLKRYARSWSLLIYWIICMQSDKNKEGFGDRIGLWQMDDDLNQTIEDIQSLEIAESQDPVDYLALVTRISIILTRRKLADSPFSNPVIQYCAFNTIQRDGAWVRAVDFAPWLSGMVHCMQLWIIGFCIQSKEFSTEGEVRIEDIMRQECQQSLINTSLSPIGELSFWRKICWSAGQDAVSHPITTVSEDLSMVSHLHIQLRISLWRKTLHAMLADTSKILERELLFGLHGVPVYTSALLYDNVSNRTPGFCFLDNPQNNLEAGRDWLMSQFRVDPRLSAYLMVQDQDCMQPSYHYNRHALQSYLRANQEFLSILAVLIYMTAGLPPRRKELVNITWRNWDVARNLYIQDGLVVIITGYHKSQWRIGTRPIARFLPHAVGNLLVQYLIHVTPFLDFVRQQLQLESLHGFFFCGDTPGPWPPDRFGDCMQRYTARYLGFPITTRQWRHISIALDRSLLGSGICSVYGIKEYFGRYAVREPEAEDSDLDGDPLSGQILGQLHAVKEDDQVSDIQASHSTATANAVYGNGSSTLIGLTDTLLARFRHVSRRWHEFISMGRVRNTSKDVQDCMQSLDIRTSTITSSSSYSEQQTAGTKKRKRVSSSAAKTGPSQLPKLDIPSMERELTVAASPDDRHGSRLEIRNTLWTLSAVERALKQFLGLHASFKSDTQREALQLVVSCPPEGLIISPTGSGKSLLFILPTLLPAAQVTIVITPLTALKQDLVRRLSSSSISFGVYTARSYLQPAAAQPSLILVDVERASSHAFQSLLAELHAAGRLDRIILDEAHLVLTASHYRTQLPALSVLRRYSCPFICLTATLPRRVERDFRKIMCMTPNLEVLRASSNRPNLCYQIKSISEASQGLHAVSEGSLIDAARQLCLRLLEQHKDDGSARLICYVRRKQVGHVLAEELDCHLYHATFEERDRSLAAWRQGTQSPIIVATSALGAGVDYAAVRAVVHVDAPIGMLDYAQETGRAGRDGLHADCVILLPRRWSVHWDRGFRSDFLHNDGEQMTAFLESQPPSCLRRLLTAYLDGEPGVTCSPMDGKDTHLENTRCGHCMQTSRAAKPYPGLRDAQAPDGDEPEIESPPPESLSAVIPVSPSACSPRRDLEDASTSMYTRSELYRTSEGNARARAIAGMSDFELYERRVRYWDSACIACSFNQRKAIRGDHTDCMQDQLGLNRLHARIRYEKYIGCWRCGQPLDICNPSRGPPCMQSKLIYRVLYTALKADALAALDMLHALGLPPRADQQAQSPDSEQLHTDSQVFRWLGRKGDLYQREASNAARFAHIWLDRLEHCVQSGSAHIPT